MQASPRLEVAFSDPEHHERALACLKRRADQSITYTDAVRFAVMETRRGAAALSFDADLSLAGFPLYG